MEPLFKATIELEVTEDVTVIYKRQDVYDLQQVLESSYDEDFDFEYSNMSIALDQLNSLFAEIGIKFAPWEDEEAKEDDKLISPLINRLIVIEEFVEYNFFDGTGFSFGDMVLEINQETGTLISAVDGYVAFTGMNPRLPPRNQERMDFLYELPGMMGYFAFIHNDMPEYGSPGLTTIAILYSDRSLTQDFVKERVRELMDNEGELVATHLFPHIDDV